MNRPYTALLFPQIVSGIAAMAEMPGGERREYSDDPYRSAGAKKFKKNKKKSRIAAASRRRNRKNGR